MGTVVRTCIGCRERADAATLVRIVAIKGTSPVVVRSDPAGSLPGRGAHLHPDPRCLEWALRRKAIGRALKVEGQLKLSEVVQYVERNSEQPSGSTSHGTNRSTSS